MQKKGSYTDRTVIALSDEVKKYVRGIPDKQAALKAVQYMYSRALLMEGGGISRIEGGDKIAWLTYWEKAMQTAARFKICPEIVSGYAYRLKLLGYNADSYNMTTSMGNNLGLYETEML